MSSSITEGSVHEGKLLVHLAENGRSLQIDCDDVTPVEALMRYVESVSGISVADQLVLCLGMKLEPSRPLSEYKLPSADKEVFIFNKGRLQSNSPPPALEQVDVVEVPDPESSVIPHDPHPLDDASDPALKALPSYERQFRYHYLRGHAIYCRSQLKYENCERLVSEQKVQERALQVGRVNLEQYYRMIVQNYTEFTKRYAYQYKTHSELLLNVVRDLEKLRSMKLHPALQTSSRMYLSDFIKEDSLRKSLDNCSNSHRLFEKKVLEFKQMFGDVKQKVEDLFAWKPPFAIKSLEYAIKDKQRLITEQKSIMQSLSKDVNTVKKLVDDCLLCQLSPSLRPHDAVSALGPMYDVHDKNHLPKMQSCDRSITKLLELCTDKKNEMNLFVHNYMQKITYISYVIKDAKLQFPVFKEAMMRQEDLFIDLKVVRGIGPAYRACLAEVVRRKESNKLYMGLAGQLAEKIAAKRDAEIMRREEFLKRHVSYIPKDILAALGLYDTPSQCDINITPFDTQLLDIDISDLGRYAPECLAGFPVKAERLSNLKSSFTTSNDGSPQADVEDIHIESSGNEDALDDCELVEIAGTSKIELENAKLKADLASAIAHLCSAYNDVDIELPDGSKVEDILKNAAEKTAEALELKDAYGNHLQSLLKAKQQQCLSYEKRIKELEERLSERYVGAPKSLRCEDSDFSRQPLKEDDRKGIISDVRETNMQYGTNLEPMDEVSCISNSLDEKLYLFRAQPGKSREELDENMLDSSIIQNTQLDSSMPEPNRDDLLASDKDNKQKVLVQLGMSLTNSSTAESMPEGLGSARETKGDTNVLLDLECAITEKAKELNELEIKLNSAVEENSLLSRELEISRKLLEESQMNCAHLENCLHEAREEAQTHLCASDRRASEYRALRESAVKLHSLVERFRKCVYVSGGVSAFVNELRALSQSLANSMKDKEDDGTADFRNCIIVLNDKVSYLSRHCQESMEKLSKLKSANEQARKELEEKEQRYREKQKQAKEEMIRVSHLELQEKAAFVLNVAGHYQAINRSCSNYYLSAASVSLFTDHLPTRPSYIIGLVVHIERQIVKPLPSSPTSARTEQGRAGGHGDQLISDSGTDLLAMNMAGSCSNTYGLPIGCEYFVVTIAMIPDSASIHSLSAS